MGHGLVGRKGRSGLQMLVLQEVGGKTCPAGGQMAGGGRRKWDGAQGAWVKPSHVNKAAFSSSQSLGGRGLGPLGWEVSVPACVRLASKPCCLGAADGAIVPRLPLVDP